MTTTDGALGASDAEEYSTRTKSAGRARKKPLRAPSVLYMLTPQQRMSPFDVNMAVDAGYKFITCYDGVEIPDVSGLVQDAMFSRPPQFAPRTGLFIGGKDVIFALDMMSTAKSAMFPPFNVSIFGDPAGSFTAAAAMVALVERTLKRNFNRTLDGLRVSVFGATGVVGFASGVLAAQNGAQVWMVAHDSMEPVVKSAVVAGERFNADLEPVAGQTDAAKARIVRQSDIVFAAGPAGVRILSRAHIARADRLMVAADLNAVGPTGIEGVDLHMDGLPLPGSSALGLGPLTIGDMKYKVQAGLFRRMLNAEKPLHLDFRDALDYARTLTEATATKSKGGRRKKSSAASKGGKGRRKRNEQRALPG